MSALASAILNAWRMPAASGTWSLQVQTIVVGTPADEPFVLPAMPSTAPPAFSLTSLVDRFLYKWDDRIRHKVLVEWGGPRKGGCFHPSEIAKEDSCDRALAYEFMGAIKSQRVVEARFQRIFHNGHFVHARLQYVIALAVADAGGYSKAEVKWTRTDDGIEGSCDMLIALPVGGTMWAYAIEIKSMKKSKFLNLGAEPWPDHRAQLNTYMHKHGVPAGFVLVECKDDQEFREYFVRFRKDILDNTLTRTTRIRQLVGMGELPDKITPKDGCIEQECSFWNICKGP